MTANELYRASLSLMGVAGSKSSPYDSFALPLINQLLADCFEINNCCRATAGAQELSEIPSLSSLDDSLPYDEKLVRDALPWGLAALLSAPDDKASFNWFNYQYAARLERYSKAALMPIDEVI